MFVQTWSLVPACFGCCNTEAQIQDFAVLRDWPRAFDRILGRWREGQ